MAAARVLSRSSGGSGLTGEELTNLSSADSQMQQPVQQVAEAKIDKTEARQLI